MNKMLAVLTVLLSVSFITGGLLADCEYAKEMSYDDDLAKESFGCYTALYLPAIRVCATTCDTLVCTKTGTMSTVKYWTMGDWSTTLNKCVNVSSGSTDEPNKDDYSSDDGCSTPCGA